MVTAGVRELKNKTSEILRMARKKGSVIVTSNGKAIAAIIPLDEEGVEDFLIAHNPKIQAAMSRGLKDIKAERTYTAEELLEELDEEERSVG